MGNRDHKGPRLGDRHETSCECDPNNGVDIFERRNRESKFVKPGGNTGPRGGTGRQEQRKQNHEGVDIFKLERTREVTSVVRDPKKPDEPEERGRITLVTAIQIGKGDIFCKITEADVENIAKHDTMDTTISLLGWR